jgi:hypothetical protein
MLDQYADFLEKKYPFWEFRLVQVGPAAFNFIYAGLKEPATTQAAAVECRA